MRKIKLFLFLSIISVKSFGQDSLWKKIVFNDFLTLTLPAKYDYNKSSYVTAYSGEISKNLYGIQYYDTVFLPIENERRFQISLTGFISGRVSDPALKRYDVTVVDTSVGATKGLFATFTTSNP